MSDQPSAARANVARVRVARPRPAASTPTPTPPPPMPPPLPPSSVERAASEAATKSDEDLKVISAAGTELSVLTASEAAWYVKQRDAYLAMRQYQTSELSELDLLLSLELQAARANIQVASGRDHTGRALSLTDIGSIQRRVKDSMGLAGSLRDSLGFSRSAKAEAASSPQTYLNNLRLRAREFGQMRNEQIIAAIALWKELEGRVGAFDRGNAREREDMGFKDEAALLDWVRLQFPVFNEIDAEFRRQQGKWIGTL